MRQPITGNYSKTVDNLVQRKLSSIGQFGMVISDAVHTEGDGLERSSGSGATSTSANLGASDVATGPARVAEQPQRREQPDEPMAPSRIASDCCRGTRIKLW